MITLTNKPSRKPLQEKLDAFERLLIMMDELREGCPWDKKQSIKSLGHLTIEETYELVDAITDQDMKGVKEELGDIMLHLVFYARIGEEQGDFDIASLIHQMCDKMVRRHPHIYGDVDVNDAEEVKRNWEQIKLQEKQANGKGDEPKRVLGGVPRSLPALVKSLRIQDKAKQVGFEWDTIDQVWEKVKEETNELQEAVASKDQNHIEEEYGDLLFALTNYARFLKVDPEAALARSNKKFMARFNKMEQQIIDSGQNMADMSLEEMDAIWNEVKQDIH